MSRLLTHEEKKERHYYVVALTESGVVLDDDLRFVQEVLEQLETGENQSNSLTNGVRWRILIMSGLSVATIYSIFYHRRFTNVLATGVAYFSSLGYDKIRMVCHQRNLKRKRDIFVNLGIRMREIADVTDYFIKFLNQRVHETLHDSNYVIHNFNRPLLEQLDDLTPVVVRAHLNIKFWLLRLAKLVGDPNGLSETCRYYVLNEADAKSDLQNYVSFFESARYWHVIGFSGIISTISAGFAVPTLDNYAKSNKVIDVFAEQMLDEFSAYLNRLKRTRQFMRFHFISSPSTMLQIPEIARIHNQQYNTLYEGFSQLNRTIEKTYFTFGYFRQINEFGTYQGDISELRNYLLLLKEEFEISLTSLNLMTNCIMSQINDNKEEGQEVEEQAAVVYYQDEGDNELEEYGNVDEDVVDELEGTSTPKQDEFFAAVGGVVPTPIPRRRRSISMDMTDKEVKKMQKYFTGQITHALSHNPLFLKQRERFYVPSDDEEDVSQPSTSRSMTEELGKKSEEEEDYMRIVPSRDFLAELNACLLRQRKKTTSESSDTDD